MRFPVRFEIRAPPDFVVDWWLDYGESDRSIDPGIIQRTAVILPDGRFHVVTDGRHGRRETRTDGIVTRTGQLTFHEDAVVSAHRRPIADLTIDWIVESRPSGSRLTAQFKFRGRGLYRLALPLFGKRLRRDREEAYAHFAKAIDEDFAKRSAVMPSAVGA